METSDNKEAKYKRSRLQIIGASFVMITGLFVMFAMANSITGGIINETTKQVSVSNLSIALWGLLILGIGVWIIRRKDFNKSVFDE